MNLEDKIKPYLIVAKAFELQINLNKERYKDYNSIEKETLLNNVLRQMLFVIDEADLQTVKFSLSDYLKYNNI